MSLIYLNNAPVKFITGNYLGYQNSPYCNVYEPDYCQLVEKDDTTSFQVKSCDFSGANPVTNGNFSIDAFWTKGTGWDIDPDNNKAEHTGATGEGTLSQDLGLQSGYTIELSFEVDNFNDNASGNDLIVKAGGNTVITISAGTPDGKYKETIYMSSVTNELIEFVAEDDVDVDILNVSAKLAPCSLTQMVTNPEFRTNSDWTISAGWAISGDKVAIAKGTSGVLSQDIDASACAYYRIEVDIEAIDNTSTGTCELKLGNNVIATFDKDTETGVKIFRHFLVSDKDHELEFNASLMGIDIAYVTVYELSGLGVTIEDLDGTKVFIDSMANFDTSNDSSHIQVDVDWSSIDEGCYKMCAYDTCDLGDELVQNGNFASGANWSFGGNWAWSGGGSQTALHTGAGTSNLNQNIGVENKSFYVVEFDVTNFNDFGTGSSILVTLGGPNVTGLSVAGGDTNGSYSFFVTVNVKVNDLIQFQVLGTNLTVDIDNVSVKKVNVGPCSECFNVRTTHGGTTLMSWTNNVNAFGFDYENFTFTQYHRNTIFLGRPQYPEDQRENLRTSVGEYKTISVDDHKEDEFVVTESPVYIHEALRTGLKHRTFNVGSVEYVKSEGDYTIAWRPRRLLAPATLTLIESDQPDTENSYC